MSSAIAGEIDRAEKRAACVELARQGMSYSTIASEVGYSSKGTVAKRLGEHFAEIRPSSEVTEDLRSLQGEQLSVMLEKLWPLLDDADLRLSAVDRIVKLHDRQARLFGLDLQQGVSVTMVTAEALASYLGWDDQVVEGTAVEVTDGSDA